ncbi:MAG: protein SanA [Elusimicrobia bacterium RIFOXYA12_FULL_51_18]|nr:MAG: protein SanA [Elusimicrobia bacterium RIFOXYA12_FULL_51_18]OGS30009.1 MAG: protein SanA [Elusimicrobia bacterium RIFOXYA2_FULL_53_38]
MRIIKIISRAILYAFLAFAGLVVAVNIWVNLKTKNFIFDDISKLRINKTGLLLGTSPFMKGGKSNPFFENRIDAATELYNKGKILNIIVSGDNRAPNYNEPEKMRRQLVKRGIPGSRIYLDYAGLRTLDSVIRCGEVFGQTGFTVISQRFHNQRAVFLARAKGFDAIGYNAKDVDLREGFKTRFREYFARLGAVSDLITYKEPRFLGDKIEIKER